MASSDTLVFLARENGEGGDRPKHDPALQLVEATASDGAAYERIIGTDSAATFASRLSWGARCFLVKAGDDLLHATWVTDQPTWTREIKRFFVPPPGSVYIYESFTRPEARGRGVYPFALVELCDRMDAEGTDRLWVGVEEGNAPSRKAIAKAHFTERFRVRFARKLGYLRVDEAEGDGVRLCFGCIAQSAKVSSQGD